MFSVCINYGRSRTGATITRLVTWAPAMITRACTHAGLGVASYVPDTVYVKNTLAHTVSIHLPTVQHPLA